MHWQSVLAGIALLGIAAVAGGAVVGLAVLRSTPAAVATVLLIAVFVIVAVAGVSRTRSRLSTPYW